MIQMHRFHVIVLGCLILASCQNEVKKKPNILFAIADDASYPHMSAYGTKWVHTPAFDYVAANGLLFNRAYTTNAKCAPSRATILTGRNSWLLEEACNHWPQFPEKFKTVTEALPEAGYYVGYTAKGWAPGKAEKNGQRRDLIGQSFNEHTIEPPAKFMSGNDYARNFQAFLESRPSNAPWFFWYGSTEPHRAYEFGAGLKKRSIDEIDEVPPYWPDNDTVRTDMLDYAFEIEYFDSHLEKMIQLLDELGELENTIIVVTADNGMPFPRVKGQVYERDHHLPLAIMWPEGIESPNRVVDEFVSFSDFAPSFLDVAGLTPTEAGMAPVSGYSLMPIWKNKENRSPLREQMIIGKERHDVGRPGDRGYPVRGILQDDYLLVINFQPDRWPAGNPETGYLNCDGSPTKSTILNLHRQQQEMKFWETSFGKRPEEELYNIKEDPYCMHNLAEDPEHSLLKSKLKDQMIQQLSAEGDPRVLGNGAVFDQYPDVSPMADFYTRWQNGEELNAGWVNPTDFENVAITQIRD